MNGALPGANTAPAFESKHVMIRTRFERLHSFTDLQRTVQSLREGSYESYISPAPRSASSYHSMNETAECDESKKVLCIWDVDDTLVSSGPPGVRQCPVFSEEELTSLFRSCQARHLLLSQGSIDDVFSELGKGKLQYLAPFFLSGGTKTGKEKRRSKVITGCRRLFHNIHAGNNNNNNNNSKEKNISGHDLSETAIIRIASYRAAPERPEDSKLFLEENVPPPRCPSDVRWLVMRPSLWGISLASLSNFIAPSPHTAFLDGSVFRKMDIVRSFAASGVWDVVFFLDNDLQELGVVRHGLGIDDYYRMKSVGKLSRFFQSDLLLLKVSAVLAGVQKDNNTIEKVNGKSKENSASRISLNGSKTDIKEQSNTSRKDKLSLPEILLFNNGNSIRRKSNGGSISLPSNHQNDNSINSNNIPNHHQKEKELHQSERIVELVVANLHLNATKYRRITRARSDIMEHKEREWWHPAFRTGQACTDDDYEALMQDFSICEAELMRAAAEPAAVIIPIPGWEPSIEAVKHIIYNRPRCPPRLRQQYESICHQILTDLVKPASSRAAAAAQEYALKETANILFRRLIRRQPVVDPPLISRLAGTLFAASIAERRLPRTLAETLQKDVKTLMEE